MFLGFSLFAVFVWIATNRIHASNRVAAGRKGGVTIEIVWRDWFVRSGLPDATKNSITIHPDDSAGTANLALAIHGIEILRVKNSRVTSAFFDRLRRIPSLKSLHVEQPTRVNKVTLERLSRLKNLERLSIEAGISDEEFEPLGRLTSLKILSIQAADFSGDGLKHLESLSNLETLFVTSDALNRNELESSVDFLQPNIERVGIYRTDAYEKGLPYQKGLRYEAFRPYLSGEPSFGRRIKEHVESQPDVVFF